MNDKRMSVFRPSDEDFLRGCLRKLASRPGLDVVLGGLVTDDTLTLTQLVGVRTDSLRGVHLTPGEGLGGNALDRQHPIVLSDYLSAAEISHHFDDAVSPEGIKSVMAVPVVAAKEVRAVVYAAARSEVDFGERLERLVMGLSAHIARELAIRDEVDRRVSMLSIDALAPRDDWSEVVQFAHAELRSIAGSVDSPEIAARVMSLSERLSVPRRDDLDAPPTELTAREIDVLSHAALGCSNAEIAARLSLSVPTVKKYLQNAMRKLGTSRRLEAVTVARRLGLIP